MVSCSVSRTVASGLASFAGVASLADIDWRPLATSMTGLKCALSLLACMRCWRLVTVFDTRISSTSGSTDLYLATTYTMRRWTNNLAIGPKRSQFPGFSTRGPQPATSRTHPRKTNNRNAAGNPWEERFAMKRSYALQQPPLALSDRPHHHMPSKTPAKGH